MEQESFYKRLTDLTGDSEIEFEFLVKVEFGLKIACFHHRYFYPFNIERIILPLQSYMIITSLSICLLLDRESIRCVTDGTIRCTLQRHMKELLVDDETTTESTLDAPNESLNVGHLQGIMDSITAKQLMDIFATGFNSFSLVVTTPEGVIVFVNNVAANGFANHTAETVCGKHLTDVTPENWAKERVRYMRKAVSTMKPVPIVEMISGTRLYSTLRPIEILHNGKLETLIFITIEPVSPLQLNWIRENVPEEDLVISEYIGLGRLSVLTPREIEVLALMGEGLRQKEIAKKLCRSVSTVDRHRERIGEKLGIKDRAELIMLAREAGLEVEDAHRKPIDIKNNKA